VLEAAGYSAEQIAELKQTGAVAGPAESSVAGSFMA
jgi:hypothetical protein